MSAAPAQSEQQPQRTAPVRAAPSPATQASRRPGGPFAAIQAALWRQRVKLEATFALAMLEPWEKVLVGVVTLVLTSLLWYSLFFHFPQHARTVVRRATYYLFGPSSSGNKVGPGGVEL